MLALSERRSRAPEPVFPPPSNSSDQQRVLPAHLISRQINGPASQDGEARAPVPAIRELSNCGLAHSSALLSKTKRPRHPGTLPAKEQCPGDTGLTFRGYRPDRPFQEVMQPGFRKAHPAGLLFSNHRGIG